MKRRLFIGSSSEGKSIAQKLQERINNECNSWIECLPWYSDDCFTLNTSTLRNLSVKTLICDYAILVASKGDITSKRGIIKRSIRDNVIFEYGLFCGSIGFSKTFMLIDKKVHLPSDFNGITFPYYGKNDIDISIDKIIKQINKSKEEFENRPLPSSALAVGYFDNFIKRTVNEILPSNSILEILVPDKLYDLQDVSKRFYTDRGLCSCDTQKNTPKVHRYCDNPNIFFDIPLTLATIETLVSNILITGTTGNSAEKNDVIAHEIQNFKDTLCTLLNMCELNSKVVVKDFTP